MRYLLAFLAAACIFSCSNNSSSVTATTSNNYFAQTDSGVQNAGVKLIQIETPKGKFNVWTKRIGNNPKIKVLLLHGGPGGDHEFFESFESFFPKEGIEFIYYDQLGSYFSDQPKDTSLWNLPRFVEEVEQVRKALNLTKDNFYLLGHSWGGILAMEYAFKYQDNLKGLIISNMMSSCPLYGRYAEDVLAKQMDPKILDTIRTLEKNKDFENPKYMQLLLPNFYAQHLCRLDPWPEALNRAFPHLNNQVYTQMQGPSEFGIGGNLALWDRSKDLPKIKIPTLTIGGSHDTMDPEQMKWMSTQVQQGNFLLCPNGSHCDMWDDQPHYFPGLIKFIKAVNDGTFSAQK
ncbi:MAG: proline iminopeptidase-family hydrolase [Ferruginibacter sp.]